MEEIEEDPLVFPRRVQQEATRDSSIEQVGVGFDSPITAYINGVVGNLAGHPVSAGAEDESITAPQDYRLRRFFDTTLRFSRAVTSFEVDGQSLLLLTFSSEPFSQTLPSGNVVEGRYAGIAVIDAAKTVVLYSATRFRGQRRRNGANDPFETNVVLITTDGERRAFEEHLGQSAIFHAALRGVAPQENTTPANGGHLDAPVWAREAWFAGELRSLTITTVVEHRTNPLAMELLFQVYLPWPALNPVENESITLQSSLARGDIQGAIVDPLIKPLFEAAGVALTRGEPPPGGAFNAAFSESPLLKLEAEFAVGLIPGNLATTRNLSSLADRTTTEKALQYYGKWAGDLLYFVTNLAIDFAFPESAIGKEKELLSWKGIATAMQGSHEALEAAEGLDDLLKAGGIVSDAIELTTGLAGPQAWLG